ncbi:flavin monoamine oxidase family protein [Streptosporangium sp. CA-135522]|uniref:flavin monoamine oxidase family protein n=1 Tax=Streptosporangium sp. CA-135522 TaxID=3240072 RepID=UPI003D924855
MEATVVSSVSPQGGWAAGRVSGGRGRAVTAETADVVVVGAGIAGLACARELSARGFGVVVVEARPTIGGRVRTLRAGPGEVIELGAQVVHPAGCDAFERLLREARIGTAPMATGVELVVVSDGVHWEPAALAARVRPLPWAVEDGLYASSSLTGSPLAGTLDQALSGLAPPARELARCWLEQVVGEDPALLDLAGTAATYHGRGRGGERVVVEGFDRVVEALARGLEIRTASPVERVCWDRDGVLVTTASTRIRGRAAVVTPPPGAVAGGALTFDPALPPRKAAAATVLASCDAVAVVLVTARPAPRSGWLLLADPPGGLWTSRAGSRLTTGHIKGPAARLARGDGWTADLLRSLGPRLGAVDDVLVMDWGRDPWARGAYSVPVTGADDACAAWAEQLGGTVFFAGEASARPDLRGLVQGALESGRRAAREVTLRLSGEGGEDHEAREDGGDRGDGEDGGTGGHDQRNGRQA